MIIGSWLGYKNIQDKYNGLFLLASGSFFLMGPLLYLFIKSSLEETETLTRTFNKVIHFVPTLLFFFLIIFFTKLQNEEVTKEVFSSDYELEINNANIILPLIKLFHLLVYTVLSIKLMVKNKNSNTWLLTSFIASYLVIQLIVWILLALTILFDHRLFQLADFLIGIVIVLAIYILGYLSIKQSDILPETINKVIKKRYKTTGLSKKESAQYYNYLIAYLKKNEPFLNPDINLKQLAFEIGVSGHQLSQIINENSSYNFSGLINQYRVNKFKILLKQPKFKDYTLLAIAFEAGFNNKNSFNNAFKKETGMTPSQFRKEIFSS
ncbi:helix-turn-helix domain-containing protein [Pontimicrobium aquaticum]|uniref:Helix-turn-helix transcriptional regulator n=1 Tax=Pontimicrobium aquaticum TaxID=2565367 RepID=A0A4U0EYG7_9FLAO|nr:AraC family transcriptional regulator [Pontimicrobium aquaticum]TJY37085.1 helix-turn-helix transcriptional regulator [Pontimicrobium aquaticum]